MNLSSFTPSSIIFFSFLLSISLPRHAYSDEEKFRNCAPTFCGDKRIDYPFWGNGRPDYCGLKGFKVNCNYDSSLSLYINNLEFDIMIISLDPPFLIMRRVDFASTMCPKPDRFFNTSLFNSPFVPTAEYVTAAFYYNCNKLSYSVPNNFTCLNGNEQQQGYFLSPIGEPKRDELRCNISVVIPVLSTSITDFLMQKITSVQDVVNKGFEVTWLIDFKQCKNCSGIGGRCGYNNDTLNRFRCFLPAAPGGWSEVLSSPGSGRSFVQEKAIIGIGAGVGVGMLFASIFCCLRRKNSSRAFLKRFLQSEKMKSQDIEVFMKKDGSLIPTKYSYSDVKKVTNLFKEKLGRGGFGTVYKGKLLDGRLVAVKILSETEGSGEEFINEVASISRTSHVNVVSLLGFCLEKQKRALIYEFMPNGSLDKFIRSENRQNTEERLEWEQFYQIAIGVARGLEYLHRGCSTRIVHFDIKPHNILLDKDFFPKISDFGLAKLCSREKSILSMLEARGTIGYIAPEVFSRNFGGVSHKSDVYSYGMVLLDIVGEKSKDENVESDATEKYFPYWVYKHIELNKFGDLGVTAVKDIEIVRKMATVGLWCIQTNPSDRPSMSRVIEMLEGNTEILEVPPKPFLFSPARSAADSCTLSLS